MKKEKLKKILKSDKLPIIIFMAIITVLHIFIQKNNDDIFFSQQASNGGELLNYLTFRYNNWTSRIVIEGVLVTFCEFLPIELWKIANIGMYGLLIYSISKLFINENKQKLTWILVICLIFIPKNALCEAGWMATMNNYLWVAATGLYAMIPIKKLINNEKINIIQAISFIISAIYACNQEQMAGIMFLIYTYFMIYLIKNKKCKPIAFIMYIIILVSLVFILTCPGNANRKISEEKTWYPNFSDTSIIIKLEQGLTSMMDYVIKDERAIFVGFVLLIAYIMLKSNKGLQYKVLGVSPIILDVLFGEYLRIFPQYADTKYGITLTIKFLVYALILFNILLCLYNIFCKGKEKSLLNYSPIFIYLVGIVSRYIMAFSPTIYASGERTAFFWYLSIIVLIILLLKEKILKKENNYGKI